jgi:tetratricopeptide (TPR) repeat protein
MTMNVQSLVASAVWLARGTARFDRLAVARAPRALCLVLFFGVLPAGFVSVAAADAAEATYRELVDEGLREYDSAHFEEARALFARAHALSPSARTLRGLALAAFELRRYVECIENSEAALASKVKPLTEEMRSELSQTLQRAQRFVARVELDAAPADAELRVDGMLHPGIASTQLVLELGEHVLELSKLGFGHERRVIHLNGGETVNVRIALAPSAELAAASIVAQPESAGERSSPPRDDTRVATRAWYKKPWLWVIVGVVVAGSVVGGVLLAKRDDDHTEQPYMGNLGTVEAP